MTTVLVATLGVVVVALVFAAGWRMVPPQNAVAGAGAAVLFFVLHPAFVSGFQESSPWDSAFIMLFIVSWLWMEHWSLFMRSWVLAGIYAFGLWVGSPFVLWILVSLACWIFFNRRPLEALGSSLTIFIGGVVLFSVTWGAAWFLIPNLGRPLFTQWIRWGGLQMPLGVSLPWALLALVAAGENLAHMVRTRRAGPIPFSATLFIVTFLFGSSALRIALMAVSAPLISGMVVKREFLYHRGVRWVAAIALGLSLIPIFFWKTDPSLTFGAVILVVTVGSRWFYDRSRLPWRLAAEAACVGAFVADSIGNLLAR
jgi:hypothetical protein